jgi:hypothetical protein
MNKLGWVDGQVMQHIWKEARRKEATKETYFLEK